MLGVLIIYRFSTILCSLFLKIMCHEKVILIANDAALRAESAELGARLKSNNQER